MKLNSSSDHGQYNFENTFHICKQKALKFAALSM